MRIHKTFRFRIKTTQDLEQAFRQFSGCTRVVWNQMLNLQKTRYESGETHLSYFDTAKLLPSLKEKLPYLKGAPAQALQQKLKDLDKAFQMFFNPKLESRPPKFKKRGSSDSFRYPQGFKFQGNRAYLPKIGWVRFFRSRRLEGNPKSVTVKREGNQWFISIQTEQEIAEPIHPSTSSVGIDLGVTRFATCSDGRVFEPLNIFRKLEERLGINQRKLSRKKKRSKNWVKQKRKVAKLHRKIASTRKDYLHKVSTELSRKHSVIVLEDLKVKNMSSSAKGNVETPGRNVRAKSGLNKSILDQGWSTFRTQLEYKQLWRGGRILAIQPHYTSQQCSCCNHVSSDNRKSQSKFVCVACGYKENADLNAAKNILRVGQTLTACESSLKRVRKQEPREFREGVSLA